MRRCPHPDVRFCPLYHACHAPELVDLGCDDGQLQEGTCGTARRVSYRKNVELLRVRAPGLVEQLGWREDLERAKAQQRRNLHLNGIH